MLIQLTGSPSEKAFAEEIITASGQNLLKCLQCGKCSGGCPVAFAVDGGPRRTIALVLAGLKDQALSSELIWYCVGCAICASRCPVDIDFSQVATALVELAEAEGIAPAVRDIQRWDAIFLKLVRDNGRVTEIRAVLVNNLRSGKPLQDVRVGLAMFRQGIIKPGDALPRKAPGQADVARIFANVRRLEQHRWGEFNEDQLLPRLLPGIHRPLL